MGVFVGNFGIKDGIQTYRINGSKEEIELIIKTVIEEGAKFLEEPNIEHVRKGDYSVLLQIVLNPTPVKKGGITKPIST